MFSSGSLITKFVNSLHMSVLLTSIIRVFTMYSRYSRCLALLTGKKNNRMCNKSRFISVFNNVVWMSYRISKSRPNVNFGYIIVHCMDLSSNIIAIFSLLVYFPDWTIILFNSGTRPFSLSL